MSEAVNHPPHYGGDTVYETIKVLKSWLSPEEYNGFLKGNVIKYLSRLGKKGDGAEDARKAGWYLGELIKALQEATSTDPVNETTPDGQWEALPIFSQDGVIEGWGVRWSIPDKEGRFFWDFSTTYDLFHPGGTLEEYAKKYASNRNTDGTLPGDEQSFRWRKP